MSMSVIKLFLLFTGFLRCTKCPLVKDFLMLLKPILVKKAFPHIILKVFKMVYNHVEIVIKNGFNLVLKNSGLYNIHSLSLIH